MTEYPGGIDEFAVATNIPGQTYDPADTTNIYAEDINSIRDAILAIENTVGVDPQGIYATVAEWLAELQEAVDTGGGGGTWGSIVGTLSDQTDLQSALNAKQNSLGFTAVANTTTINGYALSANVTLTKSDIGLGSVTNDAQLKASNLDTDGTLAANSDSKIASQKATKTYADTKVPATRTVAGYGLSSDVTLTKSDVGLSNVTNVAQIALSNLSTDAGFSSASNSIVPSALAVKTFVYNVKDTLYQLIASGGAGIAATCPIVGITDEYRSIILVLSGFSSNTATRLPKIRVSINGGSTYISTGYMSEYGDGSAVATDNISQAPTAVAAARTWNARIEISGYQNVGACFATGYWHCDDGSEFGSTHGFLTSGSGAIDALQVLWNGSGNFDGGSWFIYGVY